MEMTAVEVNDCCEDGVAEEEEVSWGAQLPSTSTNDCRALPQGGELGTATVLDETQAAPADMTSLRPGSVSDVALAILMKHRPIAILFEDGHRADYCQPGQVHRCAPLAFDFDSDEMDHPIMCGQKYAPASSHHRGGRSR